MSKHTCPYGSESAIQLTDIQRVYGRRISCGTYGWLCDDLSPPSWPSRLRAIAKDYGLRIPEVLR